MCPLACFHDGQCHSRLVNCTMSCSEVFFRLRLAVHVRFSPHTRVTKYSTVSNCDDSQNVKVRAKREYPDGCLGMPRACHGNMFHHVVDPRRIALRAILLKACMSIFAKLFASSRADVCNNHNTSGNSHKCILRERGVSAIVGDS